MASARRRRRGRGSPSGSEEELEEEEESSADEPDEQEEPSEAQPVRRRRGLRERIRSSRPQAERGESSATCASAGTIHSSASCKAARQIPDHRPSVSKRFAAGARSILFGTSDGYFLSRYQVASSTTLQMLLYFNVLYAAVYGILFQLLFFWKISIWKAPLVVELVTPMSFWVWAFIEVLRLGLGYFGNLAERVPWLMGFWMLTLFPQPIIQFYFLLVQDLAGWFTLPIEIMLSLGLEILYVAQLVVAYRANKRLVAKAAADFHLQPVDPAGDSSAAL